MRVADHARQIRLIGRDTRETNQNSEALGRMKGLGYVMVVLELCTLGFGVYHLLHGDFFLSAVALAIEIGLGVLHLTTMSSERILHQNNHDRINRLGNECDDKEEDLLGAAAVFHIGVSRWYNRIRRGYDDD
jgi:hypothetical protein